MKNKDILFLWFSVISLCVLSGLTFSAQIKLEKKVAAHIDTFETFNAITKMEILGLHNVQKLIIDKVYLGENVSLGETKAQQESFISAR